MLTDLHNAPIGRQIAYFQPQWYGGESGVTHLLHDVHRDGKEVSAQTLCGYTISDPRPVDTRKHCSSCTTRLKRYVEAAIVEHDYVEETVTVRVVRPVTAQTSSQDVIATRRSSYELVEAHSSQRPFERRPGVDDE